MDEFAVNRIGKKRVSNEHSNDHPAEKVVKKEEEEEEITTANNEDSSQQSEGKLVIKEEEEDEDEERRNFNFKDSNEQPAEKVVKKEEEDDEDVQPRTAPPHSQPPIESHKKADTGAAAAAALSGDSGEDSDDEPVEINCICGQKEDDGEEIVQCDKCILRWEHVDCIFPRTKKAPPGNYYCHVCKPRPTELTREEARAYQDRVKMEKELAKERLEKRKRAAAAKRKESAALPRSLLPIGRSSASKPAAYREIERNEYSANARRFLTVAAPRVADIVKALRNSPRVRSLIVETNVFGLAAKEQVKKGDYVAELLGYVSLERECFDRDLVPGSLNDHVFLLEMGEGRMTLPGLKAPKCRMIIDARKCGDVSKYLRRSCKPNAELVPMMWGSEMHIMIKATTTLETNEEVSIKLEEGWMARPRPAQGCGCDKIKEKDKCELERFFLRQNKRRNFNFKDSSESNKKADTAADAAAPSAAVAAAADAARSGEARAYQDRVKMEKERLEKQAAAAKRKE